MKTILIQTNGNITYQTSWDAAKVVLRRFHSDKCQHSEKRNLSNKQLGFVPQGNREIKILSPKLAEERK